MQLFILAAASALISFFAFATQKKAYGGNNFFQRHSIAIGVIFGAIALGILTWLKFH